MASFFIIIILPFLLQVRSFQGLSLIEDFNVHVDITAFFLASNAFFSRAVFRGGLQLACGGQVIVHVCIRVNQGSGSGTSIRWSSGFCRLANLG